MRLRRMVLVLCCNQRPRFLLQGLYSEEPCAGGALLRHGESFSGAIAPGSGPFSNSNISGSCDPLAIAFIQNLEKKPLALPELDIGEVTHGLPSVLVWGLFPGVEPDGIRRRRRACSHARFRPASRRRDSRSGSKWDAVPLHAAATAHKKIPPRSEGILITVAGKLNW